MVALFVVCKLLSIIQKKKRVDFFNIHAPLGSPTRPPARFTSHHLTGQTGKSDVAVIV
jgi:hypothetical protein